MSAWAAVQLFAAGWAACLVTLIVIGQARRRRSSRPAAVEAPREHYAEVLEELTGPGLWIVYCPDCASVCTSCDGDRLYVIAYAGSMVDARAAVLDHQLATKTEASS